MELFLIVAHPVLGNLIPIIQFYNVIRVFVYTWNRPPPNSDELLDISPLNDDFGEPVQLKVEPGLSSFGKC